MARLRLYYFPQVTGRTLGGAHLRSLVLDQCGLTDDGFISLIKVFLPMRHNRTRTRAHNTRARAHARLTRLRRRRRACGKSRSAGLEAPVRAIHANVGPSAPSLN
jgi:hypothetical protein